MFLCLNVALSIRSEVCRPSVRFYLPDFAAVTSVYYNDKTLDFSGGHEYNYIVIGFLYINRFTSCFFAYIRRFL